MKKTWLILLISILLLTAVLTACTDEPPQDSKADYGVPSIESGSGDKLPENPNADPASPVQPGQTDSDNPAGSGPAQGKTETPVETTSMEPEETVTDGYVVDLDEGSAVGGG